MKNIVPQNNSILCSQLNLDHKKINVKAFIYDAKELPTFKIEAISKTMTTNCSFNVGDEIIVDSTGTKVLIDDVEMFLFNIDHVVAKVN